MSSHAFAMSVEYIPDFQTYKPLGWNIYTGVPIDDSGAGFKLDFYSSGGKTLDLQSPDGTNPYWWVWVALRSTNSNSTDQIVPNPHDLTVFIQCGSTGGWYNITSAYTNYTWGRGYAIFRLTWNTEGMIQLADTPYSPTGKPLFGLQRDCSFNVNDSSFVSGDFASIYVWAQNPDKASMCNVDSSVQFLQSAVTTIVDINVQIWQILFQIFSIVIILLAIFGIPLLLFKIVRWIIEEVKGKNKVV